MFDGWRVGALSSQRMENVLISVSAARGDLTYGINVHVSLHSLELGE